MKILFICTHNRCRSILSEAITNQLGGKSLQAYSAGSQPAGAVHPLTLEALSRHGLSIDKLVSQSWQDFDHLEPDLVVTVCDSAASETCPVWFGDTSVLHWPLPDPSKVDGSSAEIAQAFDDVIEIIKERTLLLKEVTENVKDPANRLEAIKTSLHQ